MPQSNLLGGTEGQGFIQLMQQLPQERLVVVAAAVLLRGEWAWALREKLCQTLSG